MNGTHTTQYCVLATTTIGIVNPRIEVSVKWEGTDTDVLSLIYPPSDVFGADELFQKEIEDGFIITRYTFQMQLPDGTWEEIEDPRRRLTTVTALERAIDEENHKLFPGDYVKFDCDNCEDHGCQECDGDPDGAYCKPCDDRGCAKCLNCVDCDDYGCAKCDPSHVCKGCEHYFDVQDEELDHNGHCNSCAMLEYYESQPICNNNCSEFADAEDGLCSGCRFYFHEACIDCSYNARAEGDELCVGCRWHVKDNVLWRRVLRACMFWR